MKVLILDDNLLWTSRLTRSMRGLGHEAEVLASTPDDSRGAQAAIVDLSSTKLPPEEVVPRLKALGLHVIGHAGHKEKQLHELGRDAGCDQLVTNSELTFKLEEILSKVARTG
ncbi:MAG TPA: hypothetical protein VM328_07625 [Fimbriimonadaceae bacterium]|nr:hypothetical protein [Fimbriimonadaceae bacterium]